MTGAAVIAIGVFVSFGQWQWNRGAAKSVLWESFQRGNATTLDGTGAGLEELALYSRVRVEGRYAPTRQFLLDNRTHAGSAGYEVLTPFTLTDGQTILVDRGWIPFGGFRDRLPDVDFAAGDILRVAGRLARLPSPGLAAGRASPGETAGWPKLASFPVMDELEGALGVPLADRILLLDAGEPHGFVREWRPPGMNPQRHYSYAIQWWIFAVIAAGLYFGLNIRKVQ